MIHPATHRLTGTDGNWKRACDEALLVLQGATDDEIAMLREGADT